LTPLVWLTFLLLAAVVVVVEVTVAVVVLVGIGSKPAFTSRLQLTRSSSVLAAQDFSIKRVTTDHRAS